MSMVDFSREYSEAVEEAEAERKRQQKLLQEETARTRRGGKAGRGRRH